MKKFTYFLSGIMLLSTISCKGQRQKNMGENREVKNKNEALAESGLIISNYAPILIGKADFLKRVMDYEKNPDTWTYLGEMPCIVDFYADWCAPCRITSPILEEMARKYAGRIVVYKVNVDKDRELASVFGVQSIPTFLYCPMKGNPTISSGIGNTPDATRDMFRDQIEQLLLKKDGSENL
jgi:thioredoxin 1